MDFEKKSENKYDDEFAELELADQFEREKIGDMRKEVFAAMSAIYASQLFDEKYLNQVILIARGNDRRKYKFTSDCAVEVDRDKYHIDDFIRGRRRDFVGIAPKEDFEIHMKKAFEEKRVFEVAFFDDVITYEEFVAHEIAHNDFDIKYYEQFGEYGEIDGIPDVSEEYRENIKKIITAIVNEKFPNVKVEKFSFSRQQIAEIYAFLYQREFCKRNNVNTEMHKRLDEKVLNFFEDPEEMLQNFNEENDHDFTIEGHVYEENHVLSLVVAKLLEDEYPDWEDRISIF